MHQGRLRSKIINFLPWVWQGWVNFMLLLDESRQLTQIDALQLDDSHFEKVHVGASKSSSKCVSSLGFFLAKTCKTSDLCKARCCVGVWGASDISSELWWQSLSGPLQAFEYSWVLFEIFECFEAKRNDSNIIASYCWWRLAEPTHTRTREKLSFWDWTCKWCAASFHRGSTSIIRAARFVWRGHSFLNPCLAFKSCWESRTDADSHWGVDLAKG